MCQQRASGSLARCNRDSSTHLSALGACPAAWHGGTDCEWGCSWHAAGSPDGRSTAHRSASDGLASLPKQMLSTAGVAWHVECGMQVPAAWFQTIMQHRLLKQGQPCCCWQQLPGASKGMTLSQQKLPEVEERPQLTASS